MAYGGGGVLLHVLLLSPINKEGKLNAPAGLSRKRDQSIYDTGDWEGLDIYEKKYFAPTRNQTPIRW